MISPGLLHRSSVIKRIVLRSYGRPEQKLYESNHALPFRRCGSVAKHLLTLALLRSSLIFLAFAVPAASGAEDKPWDPAKGTATIAGTVKFEGKAPRSRPIDMAGADAKCAELHGGKRQKPESVIVNENGTLRNVFVWVKSGVDGWKFPKPEGDAQLNQQGCMYKPHVMGMRQGQSLAVKTSDPTAHNVHGFGKVNRSFNRSQPAGAADVTIRMKRAEASPPMKVKCDIHPWMNSYVAVVPHPYFAVTGLDGSFEIPNLPPGTYVIEAWHEKYDVQEQSITIGDNETQTLEFTYKKS